MKTLLSGKPYTNSASTDVAATFRRIRRQMKEQADAEKANAAEANSKVKTMKKKEAA